MNMKLFTKISFACLAIVFAAACNKQGEKFDNKVFIISDDMKNEVRVAVDEGEKTTERLVKVGVAQPLSENLDVTFTKSPELLENFRGGWYSPEAELLPEANCDLSGISTVIRAGDIESDNVRIAFKDLDKLDYSKVYVMPVSISSNGIGALERAKTMYFVVKEASLVNYAADLYTNCAWPIWDGFDKVKGMEQFTMEALVNCHSFANKSNIMTIMGVEDHFLIRIGDVNIPKNQIQVAVAYKDVGPGSTYRQSVSNGAMQLRTDRWYHIAVTFDKGRIKAYVDGKLRGDEDLSVIGFRPNEVTGVTEPVEFKSVDFSAPHSDEMEGKPRCFWVGYSYDKDRSLNGMIAEARVWNRVLTAEEINKPNHFYKLYPEDIDDSLIAYWKFSEGTGKIIKDYSKYGKNLTADHSPIWYPIGLPAK